MVTSSDATFCAAIAVFSLAALMAANAAAQSGRTTVFLSALLTCVIMCTQAVLQKCKALHTVQEKSKTVVQNLPATAAVLADAVTAGDAARTIAALSDELATAKAVIAVLQSSNLSDYSEKASQCQDLQIRMTSMRRELKTHLATIKDLRGVNAYVNGKVREYAGVLQTKVTESLGKDAIVEQAKASASEAEMVKARAAAAVQQAKIDQVQAEKAKVTAEAAKLHLNSLFEQQQQQRALIERQLHGVEQKLEHSQQEAKLQSQAASQAQLDANEAQARYNEEFRKGVCKTAAQDDLMSKMKMKEREAVTEKQKADAAEREQEKLKRQLKQLKAEKISKSGGTAAAAADPTPTPQVFEIPVWECDVDGEKYPYDQEATDHLENAYQMKQTATQLDYMENRYRFTGLDKSAAGGATQTNTLTNVARNVSRTMVKTTLRGGGGAEGAANGALIPWKKRAIPITGSDTTFHELENNRRLRTSEASRENHELQMALQKMIWLYTTFDIGRVKKVFAYDSEAARARFKTCKDQFKAAGRSTRERWVFHGTATLANAHGIVKEGFKVGGQKGHTITNGAIYGEGVYTDQSPDTPTQFGNFVVICLALPGKEIRGVQPNQRQHTLDHDSWYPQAQPEWTVFKRAEQLLPVYVVQLR